jgi:hypothetical protein
MGNRRLQNIECIHTLGMPESQRLKVTALNLFHPTASPLFEKVSFFHIMTQSLDGRVLEGVKKLISLFFKPNKGGLLSKL